MRHPRIDLRTVFGPHVAEGTRAVLVEHQGELLTRMRDEARPSGRAYARSSEALARRRSARGSSPAGLASPASRQ